MLEFVTNLWTTSISSGLSIFEDFMEATDLKMLFLSMVVIFFTYKYLLKPLLAGGSDKVSRRRSNTSKTSSNSSIGSGE